MESSWFSRLFTASFKENCRSCNCASCYCVRLPLCSGRDHHGWVQHLGISYSVVLTMSQRANHAFSLSIKGNKQKEGGSHSWYVYRKEQPPALPILISLNIVFNIPVNKMLLFQQQGRKRKQTKVVILRKHHREANDSPPANNKAD